MPTPACLATAVIGAPGSATNTARAESRIRWSLRAASAWRPLIGPCRPGRAFVSVMKKSVANTGTNHSVLLVLEQQISFRYCGGGSDVISIRDHEPPDHRAKPRHREGSVCGTAVALGGVRRGDH